MSRRPAHAPTLDLGALESLCDDRTPPPVRLAPTEPARVRRPVRTKPRDVLPLPTSKAKKGGRRDGRDEHLSEYLSSLGRIPLLTAEDEIALASALLDAEVKCWRLLLNHEDVVVAVRESERVAGKETLLAALDRLSDMITDVDIEAAALGLREADDDRQLVDTAITILEGSAAAGRVDVAVVQEARRARRKALEVRNRFVRANLRLVVSVARRFHHYRMPLVDLIQEGNLGLIKSVHRYDHTKGFRFSTYAHWWIRQAIERAIMNKGAQVRLPVHIFDARREVQKVTRDLTHSLGHEPNNEQLAKALNMPEEKLLEILAAVPREPQSLDDPIGEDEDRTLGEAIAGDEISPDEAVIAQDETTRVKRLMGRLTPMEMDIITRRFGLGSDNDETLEEIGRSYSLSRERVRQIQVQGLRKIQRCVEERAALH